MCWVLRVYFQWHYETCKGFSLIQFDSIRFKCGYSIFSNSIITNWTNVSRIDVTFRNIGWESFFLSFKGALTEGCSVNTFSNQLIVSRCAQINGKRLGFWYGSAFLHIWLLLPVRSINIFYVVQLCNFHIL